MGRVVVVTDSVATVPADLASRLDIRVVPIILNHEGRSYRDGVDLSPDEFYALLRTADDAPTTSTPSVGEFATLYEEAARQGSGVVAIHVTARLSSVFETARTAARSMDQSKIRIIDSGSATMAQGFIAVEAARAAAAGADLATVAERAEAMRSRVGLFAFLETLDYLRRGGRIGGAAWLMGNALHLRPVIRLVDGRVEPVAKPRTRSRAIEVMLEALEARIGDRPVHVAVLHADDRAGAGDLQARVVDRFDCTESHIAEFTPVMGAHTGPGVLGVAFYAE